MKKSILLLILFISVTLSASGKGLLIIAHGSPMPQWNQTVLKIGTEVKKELAKQNISDFKKVEVAFMEFAQPTVANMVKKMEKDNIDEIYVIPLFIAPSHHSIYDIPTILGLYYDNDMAKLLNEEQTEIVKSNIKISVGPTLHYHSIIKDIILDRVKELSDDPKNESLVLLAHGDKHFNYFWKKLLKEISDYVLANTGIEKSYYAFIGIGQEFSSNGVSVILKANEEKNKTIVVGIYLSMGVKRIAMNSASFFMGKKQNTKNLFEGKNIVFSKKGLLPDKRISKWITERSIEWLNQTREK